MADEETLYIQTGKKIPAKTWVIPAGPGPGGSIQRLTWGRPLVAAEFGSEVYFGKQLLITPLDTLFPCCGASNWFSFQPDWMGACIQLAADVELVQSCSPRWIRQRHRLSSGQITLQAPLLRYGHAPQLLYRGTWAW